MVGTMKITGMDFSDGAIAAGDAIVIDFEMRDSGTICLEVSVASLSATFTPGHNFYSRQEGQIDYSNFAAQVHEESDHTMAHADRVAQAVDDQRVEDARRRLHSAQQLDQNESDPERSKQAMDDVVEARRLLSEVRREHQKEIRQIELGQQVDYFANVVKEFARPSEVQTFENLAKTARRAIDPDFRFGHGTLPPGQVAAP